MDQLYYESGYIDQGYFVYTANGIIDLRPYIDESYLDPDYFEYRGMTATLSAELTEVVGELKEFAAALTSIVDIQISAVKSVGAVSALSATFSQEATISHIEGADLFAFSEAAIAVTVDRIRDNNVEVSDVFTVAADVTRIRDQEGDANTVSTAQIDASRSRDYGSQHSAAFSLAGNIDGILEAEIVQSSESALTADVTVIFESASVQSSESGLTCTISHILGVDIVADNFATVSIDISRTRSIISDPMLSEFTDSIAINVITDTGSDPVIESNISIAPNTIAEAVSTQSLESDLQATISHIHGADLVAFSDGTMTVDASVVGENIIDADSSFVSMSIMSRIRDLDISTAADSLLSSAVSAIRDGRSDAIAESNSACDVEQIFGTAVLLASSGTLSVTANFTVGISSTINSASHLLAGPAIFVRKHQRNLFINGIYDTVAFNNSILKYGSHSLEIVPQTDNLIEGDIVYDGTNFKIFSPTKTWTSTNGENWAVADSNLGTVEQNESRMVFFNNNYFVGKYNSSLGRGQIRYSTDGVNWSDSAEVSGVSRILGVGRLGTSYRLIYATSTDRIRAASTTNFSTWTDVEISSAGGTLASDAKQIGSYLYWATRTSTTALVQRWNGTTLNSYGSGVLTESSGFSPIVGYDGVNTWLFKSQTMTKFSTDNGSTWSDVTSPNNGFQRSISFINSNWISSADSTLWAGSSPNTLEPKTDSIPPPTTIAFGASRYLTYGQRQGHVQYSTNLNSWTDDPVEITAGNNAVIEYTNANNTFNTFKTIDFWMNGSIQIFVGQGSTRLSILVGQYNNNVAGLQVSGAGGTTSASGVINQNIWNHVRVVNHNNILSVYANGSRVGTRTGTFSGSGSSVQIVSQTGLGSLTNRYDELLITDDVLNDPNDTTITQPTRPWMNTANTKLLLHFDNNFDDDSRFNAAVQSSSSSVAAINFNGGILQDLASALTVESTLAAIGEVNITEAEAALLTDSVLDIDIQIITDAEADANAITALNIDAIRIQEGSINAVSEFASQTDPVAVKDYSLDIESDTEVSATISHIHGADIIANGFAELAITIDVIRTVDSIQTSSTAIIIDGDRLRDNEVNAISEFTQDTEVLAIFSGNSTNSALFTQEIQGNRIRFITDALDSEFTQESIINYIIENSITAGTTTELTSSVFRIQEFEIATESIASILSIVVKVGSVIIDMPVTTEMQADIIGTLEAQADLISESILTGSGTGRAQAQADLITDSVQVTIPEATKPFDSDILSEFSITALGIKDTDIVLLLSNDSNIIIDAEKFVGYSSDQSSEFTQVTQEDLFKDFIIDLESQFVQSSEVIITAIGELNADVQSSLDCTISHILGADIVADNFATLVIDYFVGKVGFVDTSSLSQLTAAFDRTRDNLSTQTSDVSLVGVVQRIRDNDSILEAATVIDAAINGILAGEITATAEVSLTCTISHILGADLVAFSDAAVIADAEVVRSAEGTLISTAAQNVTAMRMAGLESDQESIAVIDAQAMRMAGLEANLESSFAGSALGGVIEQGAAELIANGGILTVGRLVNLNMKVYKIPAETRVFKIAPETRIHKIRRTQ